MHNNCIGSFAEKNSIGISCKVTGELSYIETVKSLLKVRS